jgi:hypothetical protein
VVRFTVSQSRARLQDYHSLHLVFTTMLYKSLISFIAAFAVASGVAVSADPVTRDGSSQCDTGSVSCCDQVTSGGDPQAIAAAELVGITVGADVTVGLNCVSVLSAVQWYRSTCPALHSRY